MCSQQSSLPGCSWCSRNFNSLMSVRPALPRTENSKLQTCQLRMVLMYPMEDTFFLHEWVHRTAILLRANIQGWPCQRCLVPGCPGPGTATLAGSNGGASLTAEQHDRSMATHRATSTNKTAQRGVACHSGHRFIDSSFCLLLRDSQVALNRLPQIHRFPPMGWQAEP